MSNIWSTFLHSRPSINDWKETEQTLIRGNVSTLVSYTSTPLTAFADFASSLKDMFFVQFTTSSLLLLCYTTTPIPRLVLLPSTDVIASLGQTDTPIGATEMSSSYSLRPPLMQMQTVADPTRPKQGAGISFQ
jgi:CHASE2 domain-containing sensor protein